MAGNSNAAMGRHISLNMICESEDALRKIRRIRSNGDHEEVVRSDTSVIGRLRESYETQAEFQNDVWDILTDKLKSVGLHQARVSKNLFWWLLPKS